MFSNNHWSIICRNKRLEISKCPITDYFKGWCIHKWRRHWHPTPVLLPGRSHGRRSLVCCGPWGCEESDMTEQLHFLFSLFMHWRRKWQPTPVFLPRESQGCGSLVGCHLWGRTESDTTKRLSSSSSNVRIMEYCTAIKRGPRFIPRPWRSHYAVEQISLCATTTEAHTPGACALQQEKPLQWEKPVHRN